MKNLLHHRFWPIAIVSVLTVFVAVNVAFLTVALRHKPELVSKDYYAQGYNLKEIARVQAAGAATGWRVYIRALPLAESSAKPAVEIMVSQADGSPCDSLSGDAAFYRPSDQKLDLPALPIRFIESGRYRIDLPEPLLRGAWQAVVNISRGPNRLVQRISFFVDQ